MTRGQSKELVMALALFMQVMSFMSILLWSAFNFKWWESINGDVNRSLTLSLIHVFFLVLPSAIKSLDSRKYQPSARKAKASIHGMPIKSLFLMRYLLLIGFALFAFNAYVDKKHVETCPVKNIETKKVKVVWYQSNEYPMTIDGVMDGENVRIN